MKTFERAIFDFLETVYDFFSFFFLRGRLYDERDLLPRVKRKEGTDLNENECEYQIRLGGEESVLFIFLGKEVEIIDCFVLIRIRVTVSIIRR